MITIKKRFVNASAVYLITWGISLAPFKCCGDALLGISSGYVHYQQTSEWSSIGESDG